MSYAGCLIEDKNEKIRKIAYTRGGVRFFLDTVLLIFPRNQKQK